MQPRVLDLFAGCGGLSYGLELAGFEVVAAYEQDRWACDTYEANHPTVEAHCVDIASVPRRVWERYAGDVNVIAGGPPCQGYSLAGRRQFGEVPVGNTLVERFADVVEIVRPQLVIMENVAGFRTAQIRPGQRALPFIEGRLAALGYDVRVRVLQAANFGVPSLRSRIFVLASLDKFARDPFPEDCFGEGSDLYVARQISTIEAIGDLPPLKAGEGHEEMQLYTEDPSNEYQRKMRRGSAGVFNHVAMKHTSRLVERFKLIPPGGSGYSSVGDGEARPTVYKSNNQRLVADKPSLCITANFQSNYIHPVLHRNLTAREAARLMSFPDTYRFLGKRTLMSAKLLKEAGRHGENYLSQYNQIGNSVPPLLAEAIGRSMLNAQCKVSAADTKPGLAA